MCQALKKGAFRDVVQAVFDGRGARGSRYMLGQGTFPEESELDRVPFVPETHYGELLDAFVTAIPIFAPFPRLEDYQPGKKYKFHVADMS